MLDVVPVRPVVILEPVEGRPADAVAGHDLPVVDSAFEYLA